MAINLSPAVQDAIPVAENILRIKSDFPGNSRSGFRLKKFNFENEGCFHASVTNVWLSRLKSRNRQRSNSKSFL
jgi:hypothetical protein